MIYYIQSVLSVTIPMSLRLIYVIINFVSKLSIGDCLMHFEQYLQL